MVHETFDKDRPDNLQDFIWVEDQTQEMSFYVGARGDGMISRKVVLNKKVTMSYFQAKFTTDCGSV
jgi:hypothetical protein